MANKALTAEETLDNVMAQYPKEAIKGYHYLKNWIIEAMEAYAQSKQENYVPSVPSNDEEERGIIISQTPVLLSSSLASHSCTEGNSIEQFTADQIRKAGEYGEINSTDIEHLITILAADNSF